MNEARTTARADIALEPLLHTYRIGHAVVLERFFVLLEDLDLSPAQRRSATLIGSKYLFAYVDRVVGEVSEEYTGERQRVLRSSIQRRVQLVRDVLAGASVDSAELGYRLEQEHLAVVATGPAADASLHDLARRLERRLLTVAMTDDTVWAWLGSLRRCVRGERHDSVWAHVAGRTRYAVGEPAWGISGFRDSHEQALAAHRVAAHLPEPVTRYDDVALEAALLYDVRAARRFVEHELGPLTSPDPRTAYYATRSPATCSPVSTRRPPRRRSTSATAQSPTGSTASRTCSAAASWPAAASSPQPSDCSASSIRELTADVGMARLGSSASAWWRRSGSSTGTASHCRARGREELWRDLLPGEPRSHQPLACTQRGPADEVDVVSVVQPDDTHETGRAADR